jgi:teichoic acid transport system ATP-binding protein
MYANPQDRLKQFLFGRRKQYFKEFDALHPLSFSLDKKECLGVIGRNGSGKSTLLQILAGTLTPTTGNYSLQGKVSALLELGAGFNPDFTGRENVFLNASILGLSNEEILAKMSSIEEFAEIGQFIDRPVKTYSSGMYVRLAFSTAIHVEPELLIVDEALSVGDAAFQYKCIQKITQLQEQGMSILFVTHDFGAVKRLCNRAIWLHEGKVVASGNAIDVAHAYEDFTRIQLKPIAPEIMEPQAIVEQKIPIDLGQVREHARITSYELLDARESVQSTFLTGSTMRLRICYQVFTEVPEGIIVGAAIFRKDDLYVCALHSKLDSFQPNNKVGLHEIEVTYDDLSLLAGNYYFKAGIFDHTGMVRWDFQDLAIEFTVTCPYIAEGVTVLKHRWSQQS